MEIATYVFLIVSLMLVCRQELIALKDRFSIRGGGRSAGSAA